MELSLQNDWEDKSENTLEDTIEKISIDANDLYDKLSTYRNCSILLDPIFDEEQIPKQKYGMVDSKIRLGKINQSLYRALLSFDEEIIFDIFLTELRKRCLFFNANRSFNCIERMWHNMVYRLCLDFRRGRFPPRRTGIMSLSVEINEFMQNHDTVHILQTLIDLAQERGFSCKSPFFDSTNTDNLNKKYEKTLRQSVDFKTRFYDYVELFEKCTGLYRSPSVISFDSPKTERNDNGSKRYSEGKDSDRSFKTIDSFTRQTAFNSFSSKQRY